MRKCKDCLEYFFRSWTAHFIQKNSHDNRYRKMEDQFTKTKNQRINNCSPEIRI